MISGARINDKHKNHPARLPQQYVRPPRRTADNGGGMVRKRTTSDFNKILRFFVFLCNFASLSLQRRNETTSPADF